MGFPFIWDFPLYLSSLYNGLYFIRDFTINVIFSYKGFDVYFENVRFANRAKRSAAQCSAAQNRSAEERSGAERSAAPPRSAAQEHKKHKTLEKHNKSITKQTKHIFSN